MEKAFLYSATLLKKIKNKRGKKGYMQREIRWDIHLCKNASGKRLQYQPFFKHRHLWRWFPKRLFFSGPEKKLRSSPLLPHPLRNIFILFFISSRFSLSLFPSPFPTTTKRNSERMSDWMRYTARSKILKKSGTLKRSSLLTPPDLRNAVREGEREKSIPMRSRSPINVESEPGSSSLNHRLTWSIYSRGRQWWKEWGWNREKTKVTFPSCAFGKYKNTLRRQLPFPFSFFFYKKKKKKERKRERPSTKARLRCPRLYMTMQRSAAPVWNCTAPYRTVSGGKGRK